MMSDISKSSLYRILLFMVIIPYLGYLLKCLLKKYTDSDKVGSMNGKKKDNLDYYDSHHWKSLV